MSNPKIKVEADVTAVGAAITKVGQGTVAIGRNMAEANKQAAKSIEALRVAGKKLNDEQIQQAKKAFDALKTSGARGTRNLRGQSFDDYVGGGYRQLAVSRTEAERMRRQVFEHIGLTGSGGGGGGGPSFGSYAGSTALTAGRSVFQAALPMVGGPGSAIARGGFQAAAQSSGGLMSAGGLARVGLGLGIGGLAMAGIKGVQAVGAKIGAAQDESSEYADLLRTIGGVSTEFEALKNSVRGATVGMGLASGEAAKVAAMYAGEARLSVKDRGLLGSEVGTATSFARASGTDVGGSAQFFGALRHYGVIQGAGDQKRVAGQLQEAMAATGKTGGMAELLDTMRSFVTTIGARTLGTANFGGALGMASQLAGVGMPGLTLDKSMGLVARMDQGFASGAGGQASDNLLMSVLQGKAGGFSAMDLAAVKEGGIMGTGESVFGKGSAQYKLAERRGDKAEMARLSGMASQFGSVPLGSQFASGIMNSSAYGGNQQSMVQALSKAFGINSNEAAAFAASALGKDGKPNPNAQFAAPEASMGDNVRSAAADLSNIATNLADGVLPLLTKIKDAVVAVANFFGAGIKADDPKRAAEMERAAAAASSPASVPPPSTALGYVPPTKAKSFAGSRKLSPWMELIAKNEGMGDEFGMAMIQSIYGKESSGGKNTRTSVDGAEGGMQVMPGTYRQMMGTDEGRGSAVNNAQAGIRYLRHLRNKAGDRADLIGAGYIGGEGAIGSDGTIVGGHIADGLGTTRAAYGADAKARVDAMLSDPRVPAGDRVGTEKGRRSAPGVVEHRVRLFDQREREVAHPLVIGGMGEPQPAGLGTGSYAPGY